MKTALINGLCCPRAECGAALALDRAVEPVYQDSGAEITEGLLECGACRARYPVIAGVAVLLDGIVSWLRANYYYVLEGAAGAGGVGPEMRAWLEAGGWHLSNKPADNYYETPRWINIFTSTHYDAQAGGADDSSPLGRFIAGERHVFEVLGEGLNANLSGDVQRALDIGANVGGMAHRCARFAQSVIGIDTAFNPILTARRIHAGRPAPQRSYRRFVEGNRYQQRALPAGAPNVEFLVASAYGLPLRGDFDLVTALNVVDVVPDPRGLLERLHGALRDGGLLAISSPYSWGSDDVPVERWLGDQAQPSAEAMLAELQRLGFEILQATDGVPWVLREHQRWYRVFLNHCVIARKRPA